MASFSFRSVDGTDPYALLLGFDQSISFASITATRAVAESGDFVLELAGTGLAGGAAPTGTITGCSFFLTDLSVAGGRTELFVATGLSVSFASFVQAFEADPFGALDLLFAAPDAISGSSSDDTLWGIRGNDTVRGGDGDDELYGGIGEFDGADGNDSLVGGNGDDMLYGEAGVDTLVGGAGNDRLYGDIPTADDPPGTYPIGNADSMVGGLGNDAYWVDRATDQVVELADQGSNDRVVMRASDLFLSYTLPAHVENLAVRLPGLLGSTTVASGNTLNNKISVLDVSYEGFTEGRVRIDGRAGHDRITGGADADTLIGGSGNDTLTGGPGADDFVLNSKAGSDTLHDFRAGGTAASDDIAVSQAGVRVGDGDTVVEGAVLRSASGGFSPTAELVIVQPNIAGTITAISAAARIGDATASYGLGRTVLFAVDNGNATAVFLFTSADTNADVSAAELTLLATLSSTPATVVGDYMFVA